MIRLFLRAINAPALVLTIIIAVAIQTSLFAPSLMRYFQPDVILIAVIWFALRRGFTEGGILTLILGNLAEIHSSVPQGVFLVTYMLVFLLVRASSHIVDLTKRNSLVLMTIAATLVWKISCMVVLSLLGVGQGQWLHTALTLSPAAVVNGALGFWAYKGLERFDWITFKSARARQFLEGEYLLEGEGI